MKDQRLKIFRGAIDDLLESLDAHVRVVRWSEPSVVPEPLQIAATKLMTRLGAADRLATGVFVGTTTDATKVSAMCVAMKRLDAAYVTFRSRVDRAPHDRTAASVALEAEIGEVRSHSEQWR